MVARCAVIGRDDKSLEKFWVSPDDTLLVFGGKDGTLILVSNKVRICRCYCYGSLYLHL